MPETKIEWADAALNFYDWHCTKVSEGCRYCYAERHARQFGKEFIGAPNWRDAAMDELQLTKSGSVVFVNTHSDTYHEKATPEMVQQVHRIAVQRPDLILLVLTKRPHMIERFYRALDGNLPFPENLWIGTSVESAKVLKRVAVLQNVNVHRFISFEPLLAPLSRDEAFYALTGVEWAIVGGESGENHRPFKHEFAAGIYEACDALNVPFFFKQSSGMFPGMGRTFELTGREHNARPLAFQAHQEAYQVKADQLSLF